MSTHFSTSLGNLMFLQSNKNSSHLVFIGHDLHPLVLSVKDRRKRPEGGGGEWEPIKIPQENLAYVPKLTRHASLLARPKPHSYQRAIGPQNRVRKNKTQQKH
jgi:hypothetical protein